MQKDKEQMLQNIPSGLNLQQLSLPTNTLQRKPSTLSTKGRGFLSKNSEEINSPSARFSVNNSNKQSMQLPQLQHQSSSCLRTTTSQPNYLLSKGLGQIFTYILKKNDLVKNKVQNLNQKKNSLKSTDKLAIQETLQSVKSAGLYFENMPMMSFDQEQKGWKNIYLGILSPYTNKYQKYIEVALRKAEQEKLFNKLQKQTTLSPSLEKNKSKDLSITKQDSNNNQEGQRPSELRKRPPPILLKSMSSQNLFKQGNQSELWNKLQQLSEFKKELLISELIDGQMSRNSQQYANVLFKGSQLDQISKRTKQQLIEQTLNKKFIKKTNFCKTKFSSQNQQDSEKTKQSTLPHFQVQLDKFSYVNFDFCGKELIAQEMTKQHKQMIKREKYRNCKSMIDLKVQTYNDFDYHQYLDDMELVILNAAQFNRRKSCQCNTCGGEDNEAIKRMDKNTMDILKICISPALRSKRKSLSHKKLNRQMLEKFHSNDIQSFIQETNLEPKQSCERSPIDLDKYLLNHSFTTNTIQEVTLEEQSSIKEQKVYTKFAADQEQGLADIKEFNLKNLLQETSMQQETNQEKQNESLKTSFFTQDNERLQQDIRKKRKTNIHKQIQEFYLKSETKQKPIINFEKLSEQKVIQSYLSQQSSQKTLSEKSRKKIIRSVQKKINKVELQKKLDKEIQKQPKFLERIKNNRDSLKSQTIQPYLQTVSTFNSQALTSSFKGKQKIDSTHSYHTTLACDTGKSQEKKLIELKKNLNKLRQESSRNCNFKKPNYTEWNGIDKNTFQDCVFFVTRYQNKRNSLKSMGIVKK